MSERGLIAVTGATGFTGGHLARTLLARGWRVRALVRDESAAADLVAAGAELHRGDIRDPASLKGLAEGAERFFHIAGLFRQAKFPDQVYFDVNVTGTANCIEEARRAGVKRFVHCSTIGVLGNIGNPPADETTPYNPGDVYQVSKMEGEKLALDRFRTGVVPGVVVRPAMIYGPGDTRLLKLFRGVAHRRFPVFGSGKVVYHFVYIDDLVEAFILASEKPGVEGEVFIAGGPDTVQLNDLVKMIADEAGVAPLPFRLPVKPVQWLGSLVEAVCIPLGIEPPLHRRRVDFFVKTRWFSIDKARRVLGYAPKVDMREGVRRTLRSYREHGLL